MPVERADMQRSVAGVVARVHVGAVKEQQLEMTRETEATGVVYLEPALRVRDADVSVVVEKQAQTVGMNLRSKGWTDKTDGSDGMDGWIDGWTDERISETERVS